MDAQTLEALLARKFRQEALVVVVIARAADQVRAGVAMFLAARLVECRHRPRRRLARPGGLRGLQSEVDLAVDAVLARGVHHVFADDRAVAHDLERSEEHTSELQS